MKEVSLSNGGEGVGEAGAPRVLLENGLSGVSAGKLKPEVGLAFS
jgi:hypothetical protein